MNKRRFSRSVRFLLFVPILMILLLVSSGGLVDAQQEPQGPARDIQGVVMDDFACWTSGPVSRGDRRLRSDTNLWGEKEDEFVVDQRDLGDVARFTMKVYPEYLEGLHHWDKSKLLEGDDYDKLSEIEKDELAESLAVHTLFDSVPELVDYVFALDVFYTGMRSDRNIYDRRVSMLAAQMAGFDYEPAPFEDHRMLLPWQSEKPPPEDPDDLDQVEAYLEGSTEARKNYLERRSTGAYYRGVKSLSSEWIDPANPGGGRAVDSVALAQDQAANDMELVEGTITMAGDGGVSHYGTTEGIGQQVLFHTTNTCSGTSCSEITTYSNNPVPIVLHSNAYKQNDGQVDRNTTVKDERRILVRDGTQEGDKDVFVEVEYEFDPAQNSPSSTLSRDAGQGGYSRMHQEDTNSDELRISLVLKDKYRRDIEDYDPDKGNIFASRGLPAMGTEPWTYALFESGRHHSLNDWKRKVDNPTAVKSLVHNGYRQPVLDRPVGAAFPDYPLMGPQVGLARVSSKTKPKLDQDGDRVVNSEGVLEVVVEKMNRLDPKNIRWPVNFEDLNWYLYRLPGKYRESLWLYWLTEGGTERLVLSGYGKQALPFPVDDDDVVADPRIPVCSVPRGRRIECTSSLRNAGGGVRRWRGVRTRSICLSFS